MSIHVIIITVLLLAIFAISVTVILYWHVSTHGTWKQWPAGRSLMALLVIIALGFGWGGVNRMLGDYLLKQPVLIGLYASFAVALVVIGATIRKEMIAGRGRLAAKSEADGPSTGLVTIVVATTNEEKTDGKL